MNWQGLACLALGMAGWVLADDPTTAHIWLAASVIITSREKVTIHFGKRTVEAKEK